jgi:hypothetical protein
VKSKEYKSLLVIDFCNITEWRHTKILDIQICHDIFYSVAGRNREFEFYCISKQDPKGRKFALIEDKNVIDEKIKFESGLPGSSEPYCVLPSEKESAKLWEYLQTSQNKFKLFLNHCSEGPFDLKFINDILGNFLKIGFKFVTSEKKWVPAVKYREPILNSFEDYIYWEILSLFFNKEADQIFPYIKVCNHCKKYYKARTLRKNQKYCQSCSKKMGQRMKSSKADWNKYIRERRREEKKKQKIEQIRLRKEQIQRNMEILDISEEEATEMWESDHNKVK